SDFGSARSRNEVRRLERADAASVGAPIRVTAGASMRRVPHARRARLLAQAKINLSLRVLAREAGGHHQLETIFQRLTLGDLVTLELTNGERSLDVTGAETGPVERNLAWRAAISYAERTGW